MSTLLDQWTAFQKLAPALPTMQLTGGNLIRLHAASSEVTKGFILLSFHML